jgi:hypothetical protein
LLSYVGNCIATGDRKDVQGAGHVLYDSGGDVLQRGHLRVLGIWQPVRKLHHQQLHGWRCQSRAQVARLLVQHIPSSAALCRRYSM